LGVVTFVGIGGDERALLDFFAQPLIGSGAPIARGASIYAAIASAELGT
jgi:hypothetical protein